MALIDEIREQPEVAARLLDEASPEVAAMCEVIRAADPAHVVIAARGTSAKRQKPESCTDSSVHHDFQVLNLLVERRGCGLLGLLRALQ